MKLIKLSRKILKFSVQTYKRTGNEYIDFTTIKSRFLKYREVFIIKAIDLLVEDGFVHAMYADNTVYYIEVCLQGIRYIEENTFFKRICIAFQKIISLFS